MSPLTCIDITSDATLNISKLIRVTRRREQGHHWIRWWLGACGAPSHYLNIWWQLDPRDKIQWNLNQSTIIFIHQNAFENMVCKMAVILSQYQCVKSSRLWWMMNSLIPDAGGKNGEFINHGFGKPGYHRALSHRPLTSIGNTRLKLAWPFSVTLHWKHDERFIWSVSCVIASHVSRVRDCCFQTCLLGKISYFLYKASHSLMELVANELFFNEMKMCFTNKTYPSSLLDRSLCYTELSVWRIYMRLKNMPS